MPTLWHILLAHGIDAGADRWVSDVVDFGASPQVGQRFSRAERALRSYQTADGRDADTMFRALNPSQPLTPRQRRRALAFAGFDTQPLTNA